LKYKEGSVCPEANSGCEYIGDFDQTASCGLRFSTELYPSVMPSTSDLADPKEYQKILHWAETQQDGAIPSFATRRNDPYEVNYWIIPGG
jgi:hypothetical protein